MNRCGCRERTRHGVGRREGSGEDPLSECQERSEGRRRSGCGIERRRKKRANRDNERDGEKQVGEGDGDTQNEGRGQIEPEER